MEPSRNYNSDIHIRVSHLDMAYDDYVVMKDLNFEVKRGSVFIVMGGSGCGKSTLLKHMIGMIPPARGEIWYNGIDFTKTEGEERDEMLRRFGVLFQGGALWSTMTLKENVAFPLEQYTKLSSKEIEEIVKLKLALVGLDGFEEFYPSQISGGMRKRAGLARAMSLDPEILFFDEPSSGLDPVTARHLDRLILELKESLGTTFVVISHDLSSILALGDDSIFLDPETKSIGAHGSPKNILKNPPDQKVKEFLTADHI
jgi:phospholipid/cholesterol/gamma-HCH transport system ATP-binding protein